MFLRSYADTVAKIEVGDSEAVEFGLAFVETKPYFYRSQYIRTKLIRMLKQTKLSESQGERLGIILKFEHERKMQRRPFWGK